MTINELLSLMKIVRERLQDLKGLRSQISTKEFYMSAEKIVEPQYEVKAVDKKITELQNFLFDADSMIKQSNAVTNIDCGFDIGMLLAPLE